MRADAIMMDIVYSQKCSVGKDGRKKRSGFKPPLKSGAAPDSQETHTLTGCSMMSSQPPSTQEDRVCHTVLSYCDQERVETQPLSMFSGERGSEGREAAGGDDGNIGYLDDLLFPLNDPFSKSHCSEGSKLGGPHSKMGDVGSKMDDPFSLDSESQEVHTGEGIFDSVDEQIHVVPASPQASRQEEEEEEVEEGEGEVAKSEEVPRRRHFNPSTSSHHYNLELLPKHYRKTVRARARLKPSVNWAKNISILARNDEEEADATEVRPSLSVFEVPLSAGDARRENRHESTSNTSRESRSTQSRPDLSLSTRTRQQQLQIDMEVLAAIARTRDDIRALRAKYAAMTSSLGEMTSFLRRPTHHQSHNLHKPQLQVQVVMGNPKW